MKSLPTRPFNGQVFTDGTGVRWQWFGVAGVWQRIGQPTQIDQATASAAGLLAPTDKLLLDSISTNSGGFGFIVNPYLLHSADNPAGVVHGDVTITSHSLDITCDPTGTGTIFFSLNTTFLDSLCLEVYGPTGGRGPDGETGDRGKDGWTDSPTGPQGDAGRDVVESHQITGIKIVDTDTVTDTPIVNLEIDSTAGKLVAIKAKALVPSSDRPADQLIASPIQRLLTYPNVAPTQSEHVILDDWILSAPTGDPIEDFPDVVLLALTDDTENADLAPVNLTDVISRVVTQYKEKLSTLEANYLSEIRSFIETKDKESKEALAQLASELADCEFEKPVEFCLGIAPDDCATVTPGSTIPAPDSSFAGTESDFEIPIRLWFVSSDGYVKRSNLDGSNLQSVLSYTAGVLGERDIAVNSATGKIYVLSGSESGEQIKFANFDGSSVGTLANINGAYALAINSSGTTLYAAQLVGIDQRINVIDIATGDITTYSINLGVYDLQYDHVNDRLLMTGSETGAINEIYSMALDGSDIVTLITPVVGPVPLFNFDPVTLKIVYFDYTAPFVASIKQADLDGSNIEVMATGIIEPTAIAAYDGVIYYHVGDRSNPLSQGIYRVGTSGILIQETYTQTILINRP